MGNPLFLAFDKAVQGMVVGEEALAGEASIHTPHLLVSQGLT